MSTRATHFDTLEAYAAWREPGDDDRTELVRGRVVRQPRPARGHGRLQVELAWHLRTWVEVQGRGEVLVESGFVLSESPPTVRGPDVSLLLEPVRGAESSGWLRGAPDLAVEVLSPSDRPAAMRPKVQEYLSCGARRVWIVDPEARTLTIHRPDGPVTVLGRSDRLTDEALLPGFALSLEELFGG